MLTHILMKNESRKTDKRKNYKRWVNRLTLTVVLALFAMGIEYRYSMCVGSCSYLSGDVFGVGLQYVGIAFMIVVAVISILKAENILLVLLSAGVGVEIYLVAFQVWHRTYCLYCLAFGGILMIQFLINIKRKSLLLIFIPMIVALFLFPVFFHGSVTPVYAGEELSSVPVFGNGNIKVRVYTDYFCSPCRAMEPRIEPLLAELVKKNIIALTFIDTPFYQYSSMYAKYYLYTMHGKKDFDLSLRARNALIDAAVQKTTDPARLGEALKNKGLTFEVFDVKPIFSFFSSHFKEDKIKATPSCVIEHDGQKELFVGAGDIVRALENILK